MILYVWERSGWQSVTVRTSLLNFIQIVNHVILVRDVPRNVDELGEHIGHPHLRQLLEQFIYEQQNQNVVIGENIPPVEPLTGTP